MVGAPPIIVSADPKEDFKDLKTFTSFIVERMKKDPSGRRTDVEDTQINGKPATRVTVMGATANGQNRGAIITSVATDNAYVRIMVRASASNYSSQKQVLVGFGQSAENDGRGRTLRLLRRPLPPSHNRQPNRHAAGIPR